MNKQQLQTLPRWDLKDFYDAIDDPKIIEDFNQAEKQAKLFEKNYKGKLESLASDMFLKSIQQYEMIDERLSKIMSFAYLNYSTAVSTPEASAFLQKAKEQTTDISNHLLFYTLEINKLSDDFIKKLFSKDAPPSLKHYEPWIKQIRLYKNHQLSDEMEQLLHEKSVVGRSAWIRLFDESFADMRFNFRGKKLNETEIFDLMSNKDGAKRKEAALEIGAVLKSHSKLLTLITNVLAKDKAIDDKWRHYPTPITSRNLANHVEEEVVASLIASVEEAYPRLSHRYYKIKAQWLGADQLDYWDRNAPLPDAKEPLISWEESKKTILKAYGDFSPEMGKIAKKFYTQNWIDAPVTNGKRSGAFAHPTVPSVHPYILVNYQGKIRDVMTVAHELGHGIHQYLAGKKQGHLISHTPLTLAETASVFGEMLTFQTLLKNEKDPTQRKIMLANKIEDMLATSTRQIAFVQFELKLHEARKKAELSTEEINQIWMEVQKTSLGPALKFDENYAYWWSYIPHFIHSPFYVYAYAFGDCLVNSLYACYQEDLKAGKAETFVQKYQTLLEAGGRYHHKELLAPFGLDASRKDFWQKGLAMIEHFINELEATS